METTSGNSTFGKESITIERSHVVIKIFTCCTEMSLAMSRVRKFCTGFTPWVRVIISKAKILDCWQKKVQNICAMMWHEHVAALFAMLREIPKFFLLIDTQYNFQHYCSRNHFRGHANAMGYLTIFRSQIVFIAIGVLRSSDIGLIYHWLILCLSIIYFETRPPAYSLQVRRCSPCIEVVTCGMLKKRVP